jgi:tetratricopeptide (TPR) repeat protein
MSDILINATKDTSPLVQLTAENALWIMAIVEGVDADLFHIAEPTVIPLTEAQKAANEESGKQLQKRLDARMSQMDSNLDPIKKMIQAGIAELAAATPDTVRIIERKRPAEIHLIKLRLWVSENLTAIGLTPELEKPVIDARTIGLWLGELSDSEQNMIFGTESMERYRAGKLTSQDLLDELESVATCIATGTGDDLLELASELFDGEERIAPEKAPRAFALIEHAIKKSAGNARVISTANSMLADIYTSTGQMDKIAAYRQQRVATAKVRGQGWEIMAVARELRKSDKLTPEVAAQLIDLAESVLPLVRGFGMLCEAFDLLVETHSKLGNTEAALTCRQRYLEAVKAAIEKGIPIESNQRSNAYGRVADLCEQLGRPDEVADFRKQQLEYGDGFGLLDTALAKLKTCGKTIDNETGAHLLDFLTKAVERIPAQFPERHAVAYRATGEILEALGDKPHAVEYYEYALQKNPKVGVKKRLDALKKELGQS